MPGGGSKIPHVPGDLEHYPSDVEEYNHSPSHWSKSVTLILSGGDKAKAAEAWKDSLAQMDPADAGDLSIGEAEELVGIVKERIENDAMEVGGFFDDGPGYG